MLRKARQIVQRWISKMDLKMVLMVEKMVHRYPKMVPRWFKDGRGNQRW
jgi:hypothetical protein